MVNHPNRAGSVPRGGLNSTGKEHVVEQIRLRGLTTEMTPVGQLLEVFDKGTPLAKLRVHTRRNIPDSQARGFTLNASEETFDDASCYFGLVHVVGGRKDTYIVPAARVAGYIKADHAAWQVTHRPSAVRVLPLRTDWLHEYLEAWDGLLTSEHQTA